MCKWDFQNWSRLINAEISYCPVPPGSFFHQCSPILPMPAWLRFSPASICFPCWNEPSQTCNVFMRFSKLISSHKNLDFILPCTSICLSMLKQTFSTVIVVRETLLDRGDGEAGQPGREASLFRRFRWTTRRAAPDQICWYDLGPI
jgi:hypothetical protein